MIPVLSELGVRDGISRIQGCHSCLIFPERNAAVLRCFSNARGVKSNVASETLSGLETINDPNAGALLRSRLADPDAGRQGSRSPLVPRAGESEGSQSQTQEQENDEDSNCGRDTKPRNNLPARTRSISSRRISLRSQHFQQKLFEKEQVRGVL